MPSRIMCILGLLTLVGCSSAKPDKPKAGMTAPASNASRSFRMVYFATVPPRPPGAARVDVWVPVPTSDAQQTISDVSIKAELPQEMQTEPKYHNRVLHVWSDRAAATSIELKFRCTRLEEHAAGAAGEYAVSREPAPESRDLQPDRLGVINDRVRQTAAQITAGKTDTLGKARAIYDYVISHMAYDKITPGWGRGDTARACSIGKGNCTDFHALFISLARAQGIPARFGIGVQLPPGKGEGAIEGYHCWAEFWLAGTGWVPVDCSEAWKHPDRRDFYFGSLDDDRVLLTVGRDVRLPTMSGPPLNYFLSPYAEADGKPVPIAKAAVKFLAQDRNEVAAHWQRPRACGISLAPWIGLITPPAAPTPSNGG